MGADTSGGGTSPEVTIISGAAEQLADFSAGFIALLTNLVLACVQLPLTGDIPTYAVLRIL